ncbi:MAG: OmpH family outer membrane protein [Phaeodactylibacter xiamenensis]|jgi:outer membrane protein|uniref:Membrane protein n=1 Tax=Phaeodactylibacter xiamenensis TaxID=1524460 RepID=A0A098SA52_9BACT|nr:OmpH family outer membrane protein [Phaeodactylibacter xiamenensis]KGE89005.1 membrane protein [Phaeodactylibacter xiamenensis]
MNQLSLKKALLTLTIVAAGTFTTFAQRIAYVNVNTILESIDEYQAAQRDLDKTAQVWRQEIAQEYDKIKGMYNRYQAEQVLLSEDERQRREEEIMGKEQEVRDLQKSRFGPEGDLFKLRQDLVRPIQERVYAAIEEYAQERGYDFIFDKSSGAGMIFSNPSYDKTEDVMKKLK